MKRCDERHFCRAVNAWRLQWVFKLLWLLAVGFWLLAENQNNSREPTANSDFWRVE
jgi:hypothetical protein